jgi:hypothetical protein
MREKLTHAWMHAHIERHVSHADRCASHILQRHGHVRITVKQHMVNTFTCAFSCDDLGFLHRKRTLWYGRWRCTFIHAYVRALMHIYVH